MADTDLYRTQPQIIKMLRRVGFGPRPAKIGSAIALVESAVLKPPPPVPTADFGMVGDIELQTAIWGPSIGGFQIRSLKAELGKGTIRDANWLAKPSHNAQAAREVYLDRGWGAWSTYTSGKYKAYLQDWYPPPPNCHIVMAGETLSSIAPKYNMTWQDLARLNDVKGPAYLITIGQQLFYKELV